MPELIQEQGEPSEGLKRFLVPAIGLLALALMAWLIAGQMGGGAKGAKRQTVKIAVLPDTPPPPPPPPKEEKKPEPEKLDDKPQPQEQPKPDEAPPEPQQLKMEGAAGDGPSAFSSGSVRSEYKGGEVGTDIGGGAAVNKMQFAFFSGQLQRHIQSSLARNQTIKLGDYRVSIQIWIGATGEIQKIDLLSSSGDPGTDQALQLAFRQIPSLRDVPSDLPQPIRIRITNRMTG